MALHGPGFRNTTGKAGRVDVGAPDAEENNRTKKNEEKMMQKGMYREPLKVTQEAVDAYEKRSGFHGIGKKMVEHGRWIIVTKEEVSCTP